MKLHKLFHLLALLALVACAPTLGPAVSTPTTTPRLVAVLATVTATPVVVDTVAAPSQPGTASPTAPASTSTTVASATSASPQLGHHSKTTGCQAAGALPDPACTPGAIFPDVTAAQVCVSGYSASVRNVPASEKDAVYAAYGITSHSTGQYEVDHFVSLELGGSNDISNLWPEPASPVPGFHQKDTVENYLHDQVCKGAMTLAEAQHAIATNWLAVYASMSGGSAPPAASPTRVRVNSTPAPAQPTATLVQQAAPTNTHAAAGPTDTEVAAAPTDTEVPVVVPSDTPAPADTQPPAGDRVRVGAHCNDGTESGATGRGACSHHQGVQCWKYSDGTCTNP